MHNANTSGNKSNAAVRVTSFVKKMRHQINIIVVAAALGLVCVLNVTMAPEGGISQEQALQISYLNIEVAAGGGRLIR